MYIIEKVIRLYLKFKNKNQVQNIVTQKEEVELEDVVTCKHNFMPIDSTGQILACSKCGYLVNKSRLKKDKNFFIN